MKIAVMYPSVNSAFRRVLRCDHRYRTQNQYMHSCIPRMRDAHDRFLGPTTPADGEWEELTISDAADKIARDECPLDKDVIIGL